MFEICGGASEKRREIRVKKKEGEIGKRKRTSIYFSDSFAVGIKMRGNRGEKITINSTSL